MPNSSWQTIVWRWMQSFFIITFFCIPVEKWNSKNARETSLTIMQNNNKNIRLLIKNIEIMQPKIFVNDSRKTQIFTLTIFLCYNWNTSKVRLKNKLFQWIYNGVWWSFTDVPYFTHHEQVIKDFRDGEFFL